MAKYTMKEAIGERWVGDVLVFLLCVFFVLLLLFLDLASRVLFGLFCSPFMLLNLELKEVLDLYILKSSACRVTA